MKRIQIVSAVLILLAAVWLGTDLAAGSAEERMNFVRRSTPYQPTRGGEGLHRRLVIVDLHADALLWNRDLNQRGRRGQVDIPRLLEGNVALQVFGVVTKAPRNNNPQGNADSADDVWLLVMAQKWPPSTWSSLLERALYQARKLDEAANRSGGNLSVVRTRADLEALLERRQSTPAVGALLALEGMHALEGQLENVDRLFDAGFRMLAPAHFSDTDVAGSSYGIKKYGLTELGRAAVGRMEEKGITLDLAHISSAAFDDALAIATRPVVVSHTGVKGTCDRERTLSDDQLRKVAQNGGVVGIGYWSGAVCGVDVSAIVRALQHAVSVAGINQVGLGSDFDGSVAAPFDTAGLGELTDALLGVGFHEDELQKLMGGNALRVLSRNLPER